MQFNIINHFKWDIALKIHALGIFEEFHRHPIIDKNNVLSQYYSMSGYILSKYFNIKMIASTNTGKLTII